MNELAQKKEEWKRELIAKGVDVEMGGLKRKSEEGHPTRKSQRPSGIDNVFMMNVGGPNSSILD